MTADKTMHELLPWYVTGKLEPELADEFKRHLPACDACRREMVVIEKLRAEIDQHGGAFLDEHPPPGQVVAAARGEGFAEAETVRRHLALCETCAEESSWVRGEASYGAETSGTDSSPSPRIGTRFGWAAAIAATLLVASLPLWWTSGPEITTGVVSAHHLKSTQRGSVGQNVFTLDPGETAIRMIAQVDIAEDRFPLTVVLVDGGGHEILRQTNASLLEDLLIFDCTRDVCSAGRYALLIYGAGEDEPELTFGFETVEP